MERTQVNEAELFQFSKTRLKAAQAAMGKLLERAGLESFTGTFESPGEAGIEVAGGKERDFGEALAGFLAGQGARVLQVSPENAADWVSAPFETVLIMCSMPATPLLGKSPTGLYEAAAEVLRVILAAAIRDAKADATSQEDVTVRFRKAPEFLSNMDFENDRTVALGRMRASVVCDSAPEASYLLGSVHGMPKPFSLAYELPLVEMFYGENRIRWKDRRAPDCDALIQVVGGVA